MSSVVGNSLRENKSLLWETSKAIWNNPELCYEEVFAHDLLASTLESFGFHVQRHYFLHTAFRAEFCSDKEGPTIAVLCEYDALPGIGHACGHNLIAEIGLGVGLAVKEAMTCDSNIGGKIVVMGTPAEEGGGGKIQLIQKGAFRDVDATLMAHPQAVNRLYPLIVESCNMTVKFKANPGGGPWEGPSAVDAAVACYTNVALFRRSIPDKCRVSLIIPTSRWKEAEVEFIYRSQSRKEMNVLREKLEICVQSAAQATNCTFTIDCKDDDGNTYRGLLYNKTIVETFEKHANELGVHFCDNDPKVADCAVSSDMGNVSQILPGMQPEYDIGAYPHVNHTRGFAEAAGSEAAQTCTLIIAEALAKTVLDLMTTPELVIKMKKEFDDNPLRDPDSYKMKAGKK